MLRCSIYLAHCFKGCFLIKFRYSTTLAAFQAENLLVRKKDKVYAIYLKDKTFIISFLLLDFAFPSFSFNKLLMGTAG